MCRKRGVVNTGANGGIPSHYRYSQMKSLVDTGETLQSVAQKFGISRERVRQIVGNVGKSRRFDGIIGKNIEKILSLWEQGKLFTEISAETGVPLYYILRLKLPRNFKPIPHGKPHVYSTYGCRCDVCRRANNDRVKQRNWELREKGLCIKCQIKSDTWICYDCGVRLRKRTKELREMKEHGLRA